MILIISTCKERLHYFEFVKPIVDIVKDIDKFLVINASELNDAHINNADKIIITGTSLADFGYDKYMTKFEFLKSIKKPVLGICAGMQIICKVYGCKTIKTKEIGLVQVSFDKDFLGMNGEKNIYALHNLAIREDALLKKHFNIYAKTTCVQAIKHKTKSIYAALFHPEVRNKDLIVTFLYGFNESV